jgi:hypothetical protein
MEKNVDLRSHSQMVYSAPGCVEWSLKSSTSPCRLQFFAKLLESLPKYHFLDNDDFQLLRLLADDIHLWPCFHSAVIMRSVTLDPEKDGNCLAVSMAFSCVTSRAYRASPLQYCDSKLGWALLMSDDCPYLRGADASHLRENRVKIENPLAAGSG